VRACINCKNLFYSDLVFDQKGEVVSQGNITCKYFEDDPEEIAERVGAPNLFRKCDNWAVRIEKKKTGKPFNKFRYNKQ
jgi:hypothetical protein